MQSTAPLSRSSLSSVSYRTARAAPPARQIVPPSSHSPLSSASYRTVLGTPPLRQFFTPLSSSCAAPSNYRTTDGPPPPRESGTHSSDPSLPCTTDNTPVGTHDVSRHDLPARELPERGGYECDVNREGGLYIATDSDITIWY